MFNSMRKVLVSLSSLGFMGLASTNVIACTPLNDLQKSFNYDNNVKIDNQEFTLEDLGLKLGSSIGMYDFYFNNLDVNTTFKIIKVKPNQPVSALFFEGKYPSDSPNKDSEIAILSGNNYIGEKGLTAHNKVVSIPLTLSLMDSSTDPDSKTGFSYHYTSLIMNIKINVTLNK